MAVHPSKTSNKSKMKVNVRFFALYRERAGLRELPVKLPVGSTVSRMVAEVRRLFPDLAPPTVDIVVSVNAEYAGPDTQLSESDDVQPLSLRSAEGRT